MTPEAPELQLKPGSIFAGHKIEAVAGRGGMGVVYRATHIALDIPVALKIIAPELATDDGFRERFKRESRLAASIEHPNVISVRHAGEDDGVLYVTMRFVEGTDLGAKIEQAALLDLETSVEVITQVAAALDAAHGHGLIHRDVKPANVLIEEGSSRRAYLTDFGLTRKATSGSGLTRTGQWVGTLQYVAPEQIRGKTLDARADIYALGAVTYHCLSGQPPFTHDSDPALIYAHLSEMPERLTTKRKDISSGVADVVERAMAKEPGDRFSSAGEFATALKQAAKEAPAPTGQLRKSAGLETKVSSSVPTDLARQSVMDRVRIGLGNSGRRRALLALIGVAFLALIVASGSALFGGGDGEVSGEETADKASGEVGGIGAAGKAPSTGAGGEDRATGSAIVDPPSIPVAGWPLGLSTQGDLLVVASRRGRDLRTINKETREEVSRTPLPGRGEDVAIQGGAFYVTMPQEDAVARLPLDGTGPEKVIPVGNEPRGIVSANGYLWVSNLVSGTVSRIASDGTVVSVPLSEGAQPQDVAVSRGVVWVSDRSGNVIRVKPGAQPESFPAGRKPRGIVVVGRDVWVANTGGGSVTRLGTDGRAKEEIDVGGMPRGIAAGFGRIWVANGEGYLTAINSESGAAQRIKVGGAPEEVTVARELVWVTTGTGDSLVAVNPGAP